MLHGVGTMVLWSKVVLCSVTVVDDNCYSAMMIVVFLDHDVLFPYKFGESLKCAGFAG